MGKELETLERIGYKYALGLQRRKLHPAAVIVAGKSYYKKKGRTGNICIDIFSFKLRNKLLQLGELYSRQNGNFVGNCAEVKAANQVLLKLKHLHPEEINFSNARRPRTMQIIPPCKNCKFVFNL